MNNSHVTAPLPKVRDAAHGPDHHDADLLLKLYDLRRETEMRKTRDWCLQDFNPRSLEDLMAILRTPKSDESRRLRQVVTYYEMVASLVHRGVLDRDLMEDSVGEYINIYAKMKPFLKEFRAATGFSEFMGGIERLVEESPRGRERLARTEKMMAAASR